MVENTKIDLKSVDIAGRETDALMWAIKDIVPSAVSETGIDFEELKKALGEKVWTGNDRFGLVWPGKDMARQVLQERIDATLKPNKEQSVNFDTTQNVIIEGDNLSVLKLLQNAYFEQVKMIYIDPPYNTGHDFVYKDKYGQTLQEYLEYTEQVNSSGKRLSTNTEESGRYHTNWLNMMWPRLYLARQLLREDGVIFVSIDDNEVANLRLLMNEIFGEENFVGQFVVNSTPNARDYGHIGKMHEYILFYTKDVQQAISYMIPDEDKTFKYTDKFGGFNIHPLYNSNVAFTSQNRPNLFYPFYIYPENEIDTNFLEIGLDNKDGAIEIYPPKSLKEGIQFVWRWGKTKAKENLNTEIIGYKTEDGEYRIVQKMRHSEKIIRSLLLDKDYTSRRGTAELEDIFNGKTFDFPKPKNLIKLLAQSATKDNDIALDFFAGSGTTAQAIMELNKEDGGNRRFVLVQLPETTDEKSEAFKTGYKTIAEITRERVRRVIAKIQKEQAAEKKDAGLFAGDAAERQSNLDLGFKAFSLAKSCFTPWNEDLRDEEDVQKAMQLSINYLQKGLQKDDLLYEITLKLGLPLDTEIAQKKIAGFTVFSIADDAMLICLDEKLNQSLFDEMIKLQPAQVICLDKGFEGNDQLKTNVVQTFKATKTNAKDSQGIVFKTV